MDADRNLLFGLIALQNGLIDQGALVAAFQAWTRDRSNALADLLIARGDLDAAQRALLDGLVDLQLKKHGGSAGATLATLGADRATRDSLARLGDTQLEQTLAHLGSGPAVAASDETVTYAVGAATADGQRFRVLRPHARGGLGAVFVALDEELHREVALKQILDGHADDPISRSRFLLEAEVTGGLEHPGIVPVYGLGRHDDGRPYYAMRFVRGDSLKEAIERFHADASLRPDPGRRSLELRKLLRRFLDVCNAIQYAHTRGVLHRDIKPGNIIVGKHGETLVVDWGLARVMGRAEPGADERPLRVSTDGDPATTVAGSALGTPAYMSPEQARGDLDALGPPADVYSLGATLYCLLTGRPPFAEGDVGTALRKVEAGDFPRPRQVDPAIDPALEAACLKAMANRPADRYDSPRVLAEDIDHWLADQPVTAYREPWRRRLARWERRHKALVHGGIAALVIIVVSLAVTGVVISREKRATEQALEKSEYNARLADNRFQQAADAVYQLLSQTADQEFNRIPGMEKVRRRLTDQAYSQYVNVFVPMTPDDARILSQGERVCRDAALVRWLTGDLDGARRAFAQAVEWREKLRTLPEVQLGAVNSAVDNRVKLSSVHRDFAAMLQEAGLDAEAAPHFAGARRLADGLLADMARLSPAEQRMVRQNVGWLDARFGDAGLDHGDTDAARATYLQALDLLAPLAADPKEWYWYRLFTAQAHRGLGQIARERGDSATAEREFAEALRIARAVVAEQPGPDPDPPDVLARTLTLHAAADPPDTDAELDEAVGLFRKITGAFPAVTWYRHEGAEALLLRARRHAAAGRDEDAERDLTDALAALKSLMALVPEDRVYPADRARVEAALGRLRLRQGRSDEARSLIDQAIARLEQATRARPQCVKDRRSLADARSARQQLADAAHASP